MLIALQYSHKMQIQLLRIVSINDIHVQ